MDNNKDDCYEIPSWGIALNVARNVSSSKTKHDIRGYHPWGPFVCRLTNYSIRLGGHYQTLSRTARRLARGLFSNVNNGD